MSRSVGAWNGILRQGQKAHRRATFVLVVIPWAALKRLTSRRYYRVIIRLHFGAMQRKTPGPNGVRLRRGENRYPGGAAGVGPGRVRCQGLRRRVDACDRAAG
jgi:hypothetical protein